MSSKKLLSCFALFIHTPAICDDAQKTQAKFQISKLNSATTKKFNNHINIEKIIIKKSKQVSGKASKKISYSLDKLANQFYADGKYCYDPTWNGPWGYEAKLANIYITRDIMSVVFEISAACSGNIEIDKISMNYSTNTGLEITAKYLLDGFPTSLIGHSLSTKNNMVKLDAEAIGILIKENKNTISPDMFAHCTEYFARISYSIWMRPDGLILSPLFSHRESECHNDYAFKFR